MDEPDWRLSAPCAQVDPDLWHPETGQNVKIARRICAGCPFTTECLQIVLDDPRIRHGVWAGMTVNEIDKLYPLRSIKKGRHNAWTSEPAKNSRLRSRKRIA